jgi:hypothetical protein
LFVCLFIYLFILAVYFPVAREFGGQFGFILPLCVQSCSSLAVRCCMSLDVDVVLRAVYTASCFSEMILVLAQKRGF